MLRLCVCGPVFLLLLKAGCHGRHQQFPLLKGTARSSTLLLPVLSPGQLVSKTRIFQALATTSSEILFAIFPFHYRI